MSKYLTHIAIAIMAGPRLWTLSPILDGSIAEWLHELADLIEFRHC
jgi:hypothetical protein